jgi:hypothetical protein
MRGFLQGCRESGTKRPEVARTVAGGRVRSARPPDSRTRPDFPTAAAVAEGIHAAWYLIRDPGRGRGTICAHFPVVSRSASDHRLSYESPPGTAFR